MSSDVEFKDNSIQVKAVMDKAIIAALHECAGEIQTQAAKNTRVQTGQTKASWEYAVDSGRKIATIGSDYENAIWEEFGTGEYALEGNGRRGGWSYKDDKGVWHFTMGKRPQRAFWNAYNAKKTAVMRRIRDVIKRSMG